MNLNATQFNKISDMFQNLSNAARQAGSSNPTTASTSAQYFNQLLAQMSQNLHANGSLSTTNPANASQSASNSLSALLGKYI